MVVFVDHDVSARHEEQAFVSLEEETACIRQQLLLPKRAYPRRGEQKRVNQFFSPFLKFAISRLFNLRWRKELKTIG